MTKANTFPHPILITGGAGFLGSHMSALCLEIVAGHYLKNLGLESNQSVKLINSGRVGYYSCMSTTDFISSMNPELQNTQLVILNRRDEESKKILETDCQLEKSFTKNYQGDNILKRITSD
jgi:nucleoside-diphosphate-sugar epimerase